MLEIKDVLTGTGQQGLWQPVTNKVCDLCFSQLKQHLMSVSDTLQTYLSEQKRGLFYMYFLIIILLGLHSYFPCNITHIKYWLVQTCLSHCLLKWNPQCFHMDLCQRQIRDLATSTYGATQTGLCKDLFGGKMRHRLLLESVFRCPRLQLLYCTS